MKYETGNIWNLEADGICIPTNGVVKKDGTAVMGAGLALQASNRYPTLKYALANALKYGNKVRVFSYDKLIYTVPTKHNWKDNSDLNLIEESLIRLVYYVNCNQNERVLITKLGCGLGGLDWSQVEPLMSKYLDDRFVLVTPK